jgi:hypothetical protein
MESEFEEIEEEEEKEETYQIDINALWQELKACFNAFIFDTTAEKIKFIKLINKFFKSYFGKELYRFESIPIDKADPSKGMKTVLKIDRNLIDSIAKLILDHAAVYYSLDFRFRDWNDFDVYVKMKREHSVIRDIYNYITKDVWNFASIWREKHAGIDVSEQIIDRIEYIQKTFSPIFLLPYYRTEKKLFTGKEAEEILNILLDFFIKRLNKKKLFFFTILGDSGSGKTVTSIFLAQKFLERLEGKRADLNEFYALGGIDTLEKLDKWINEGFNHNVMIFDEPDKLLRMPEFHHIINRLRFTTKNKRLMIFLLIHSKYQLLDAVRQNVNFYAIIDDNKYFNLYRTIISFESFIKTFRAKHFTPNFFSQIHKLKNFRFLLSKKLVSEIENQLSYQLQYKKDVLERELEDIIFKTNIPIVKTENQEKSIIQERAKIKNVYEIIEELSKIFGFMIPEQEVIRRAKEIGIDNVEEILNKMKEEGTVKVTRPGFISLF